MLLRRHAGVYVIVCFTFWVCMDVCLHRQLKSKVTPVPQEIRTMWQRAVSANCKAAKTALFQKWLTAGKDYAQLLVCKCVPFFGQVYCKICPQSYM